MKPIDPDALANRAVRFLEESVPEWGALSSSEQLGMTTDLVIWTCARILRSDRLAASAVEPAGILRAYANEDEAPRPKLYPGEPL